MGGRGRDSPMRANLEAPFLSTTTVSGLRGVDMGGRGAQFAHESEFRSTVSSYDTGTRLPDHLHVYAAVGLKSGIFQGCVE